MREKHKLTITESYITQTNHTLLKIIMSTMTTPDAMADTGTKLLKDERLTMRLIKNSLETTRKFTWDRVTDVFENAIKG